MNRCRTLLPQLVPSAEIRPISGLQLRSLYCCDERPARARLRRAVSADAGGASHASLTGKSGPAVEAHCVRLAALDRGLDGVSPHRSEWFTDPMRGARRSRKATIGIERRFLILAFPPGNHEWTRILTNQAEPGPAWLLNHPRFRRWRLARSRSCA